MFAATPSSAVFDEDKEFICVNLVKCVEWLGQ